MSGALPAAKAQTPVQSTHPGNNFDAIRIAAAVMVLVSHHHVLTGFAEPSFWGIHSYGGISVAIFFVISGYLVAGSWERDPHLFRFAVRRILRIWPALTAVLLFTAYGLGAWVTQLPLREYLSHAATVDYLRGLWMHIHFVLPGVFEHNPARQVVNGSLWTIPIEVTCYIALGAAGLAGLLRYRLVALSGIALYMAWFLTQSNADLTGVMEHGPELGAFFLAGAVLHMLEPWWEQRPIAWAMAIGTTCAIAGAIDWRHTAVLIGLPFVIIFIGTHTTPFLRRAGRWGDPSYGIYLLAFPIQQTVIQYAGSAFGFVETMAMALGVTVVLAYASWHLLEKQALKFKPNSSKRSIGISIMEHSRSHIDQWIEAVGRNFYRLIGKISNVQIPADTGDFGLMSGRVFSALLFGLLAYYALWLLCFWPGVLGYDSLGILKEVEDPIANQSGKTVFWYFFVRVFYSLTERVEYPIAAQLVLGALVFARILAWQWSQQLRKIFFVSLLLVAIAPHMVFFLGTLYPDGVFSVAVTGLMFELWLAARLSKLSRLGALIIMLTLPLALFARSNGIVFLLPIFATFFFIPRRSRWWLAAIASLWIGLNTWGQQTHTSGHTHGAVLPLVLFETVNFLQPRPMNLWTAEPRVAPRTVEILTSHRPMSQILAYYDRDYWDTLIFSPDGPRLLDLSRSDQKKLVRDFFRYNLWHNMPDFVGSRTRLFLVAALAQGGFPGLDSASQILPLTESISAFRPFSLPWAQNAMRQAYEFSFSHRWLLWSPLPGVFLLAGLWWRAVGQRNRPLLLLSIPLVLQLGGIVFFSIAGEYRYVMPFFTLIPVLLSAWALSSREPAPATQTGA